MIVAIDTETVADAPWSVQWCMQEGKARMALVEGKSQHLRWLRTALESSDTLTVVHNAIFDVGILHKIGIMPAKVADTMVMAYLLGEPSIGLKTLSYRYCNMDLTPYKQMAAAASEEKARAYISAVVAREWPDPPPVVETRPSGEQHVKFPQNISKRLPRYLKKYEDGTAAMDLVEYWNHKDRDADRQMVEPVLGQLEPGCLSDIPLAAAVHYACTDADATFRLYPYLWQRIVDEEMEDVFWRDMNILPMVVDMMETGILIDTSYFHGLSAEFDQRAQQLLEEIESINGAYLNPASSKQVLEALKRRGLDVQSTEAGELDQYRHDELVRLIQDYRGIVKLNSTYVSVLPDFADAAGRVHTTLSTTRTSTGRLASSSPNLQNQPVRSEDGRRIRSGFIAADGCSLMAIDYSQIELRKAADESQDPVMLRIFNTGGDMHMETACAMFGLPPDQIDDKRHRRPAKTVNFGVIYGISAPTLLTKFYHEDILGFSEDDCRAFIDSWRNLYAGYFQWAEEVKGFALRNGYVVDMFGRRRYVPEVYSSIRGIRESGFREAVNAPIQSGAGGILKEAMCQLIPAYRDWQLLGYIVRPLLQVHDELIFEVEDDILPMAAPQFKQIMESVVVLSVPLIADVKTGTDWGHMTKWEE